MKSSIAVLAGLSAAAITDSGSLMGYTCGCTETDNDKQFDCVNAAAKDGKCAFFGYTDTVKYTAISDIKIDKKTVLMPTVKREFMALGMIQLPINETTASKCTIDMIEFGTGSLTEFTKVHDATGDDVIVTAGSGMAVIAPKAMIDVSEDTLIKVGFTDCTPGNAFGSYSLVNVYTGPSTGGCPGTDGVASAVVAAGAVTLLAASLI